MRLTRIALKLKFRVRKYAKFGAFYAKIVQMTPLRLVEGVTSTPEIFGNKQGATLTPEICGNKHSFVPTVTFSQQIQFTLIVNVVNLH